MYYDLFTLLQQHIYGADVILDEYQTLVLTNMATIGCLFVVSVPFLVVGFIIFRLFRW